MTGYIGFIRLFKKYPGFLLVSLLAFLAAAYFLYELPCDPQNCVGIEINTMLHRVLTYFTFSIIIAGALVLIRTLSTSPKLLETGLRHYKTPATKENKRFSLISILVGVVIVSFFAVRYEYSLSQNYTLCYETTGEFDKERGDYKYQRRGGMISDALYVNKATQCPDRLLFMYWYDEQGREFESLDSHPDEIELQLSTVDQQ